MFKEILKNVHDKTPLVHCITNYVTVNDVANILLACGGSPVMADDEDEVCDITSISNATVINIGTLNKRTIISMIKAAKKANSIGNPLILDPVGAGASKLRTDTTMKLTCEAKFSVIRGNISEIKTIALGFGSTKGVDADIEDAVTEDNLEESIKFAKSLSKKLDCVIAITGVIDLVADANKCIVIRNGDKLMSKVTGTGCMSTAIIGAFCGANKDNILEATAAAISAMGQCGELAKKKIDDLSGGTSSFRSYIIDYMSKMTCKSIEGGAKIEIR